MAGTKPTYLEVLIGFGALVTRLCVVPERPEEEQYISVFLNAE